MRSRTIWAGALAVLALAASAPADTLEFADGGKVQGRLEELTIVVDGIDSLYARDRIKSVALSSRESDAVTLQSGLTRTGKITTVRFRSAEGLMTNTRSSLKAVVLDDQGIPDKKEEPDDEGRADVETRPIEELSPEELKLRKALDENKGLYIAAKDKAQRMLKEEKDKLEKEHGRDWQKVNQDLERYEQSIKNSIRQRREAEERWREYRRRYVGSSRYIRHFDPSRYDDAVERAKRDYLAAKRKRASLKQTIQKKVDHVEARDKLRRKRIYDDYRLHRKVLLEGKELTGDQMKQRYFDSLQLRAPSRAVRSPRVAPKQPGPFDAERRPNPFDEMEQQGRSRTPDAPPARRKGH